VGFSLNLILSRFQFPGDLLHFLFLRLG
jgi:hypothetical protein